MEFWMWMRWRVGWSVALRLGEESELELELRTELKMELEERFP
jgi:hypothetical protein